jgi:hypothetical protein
MFAIEWVGDQYRPVFCTANFWKNCSGVRLLKTLLHPQQTGYEIGYEMKIENHIPLIDEACSDQLPFNV